MTNQAMVDEVAAQLDAESVKVRAVFKTKDKARQCVAVGGGPFEGRKL